MKEKKDFFHTVYDCVIENGTVIDPKDRTADHWQCSDFKRKNRRSDKGAALREA